MKRTQKTTLNRMDHDKECREKNQISIKTRSSSNMQEADETEKPSYNPTQSINPYIPPQSTISDHTGQRFYSISTGKFIILYLATFGLFRYYWHYKNWALEKQHFQDKSWPIMRMIFSIFFVHELFSRIENAAKTSPIPGYKLKSQEATPYVIVAIFISFANRINSPNLETATIIIAIVGELILGWLILCVQKNVETIRKVSNLLPNNKLTGWNWLVVIIGSIIYVAVGAGMMLAPTDIK